MAKQVFVKETTSKIMGRLQGRSLREENVETDDLLGHAEPKPSSKPLPTEIRSNICVLLVTLSTTRKRMMEDGSLSEEVHREIVEGLEGIGSIEGEGEEGSKMAAAQALIAWQS